jgi:hypothetical protein
VLQSANFEDDAVDALIEVFTATLREDVVGAPSLGNPLPSRVNLIEAITARVLERLRELTPANVQSGTPSLESAEIANGIPNATMSGIDVCNLLRCRSRARIYGSSRSHSLRSSG